MKIKIWKIRLQELLYYRHRRKIVNIIFCSLLFKVNSVLVIFGARDLL